MKPIIAAVISLLFISSICSASSAFDQLDDVFGIRSILEITRIDPNVNYSEEERAALRDLQQVEARSGYICSLDKVNKMKHHHERYAHNRVSPKNARNYFIAYGLLVSDYCKRQMVKYLISQAPANDDPMHYLKAEDQKVFEGLVAGNSSFARLIKEPKEYNDLELPKLFTHLIVIRNRALGFEKIYLSSKWGQQIRRIQTVCKRRLAPIYKPLIEPVFNLAAMGFNFVQKKPNMNQEDSHRLYRWYRAAYFCEMITLIYVLDGPSKLSVIHESKYDEARVEYAKILENSHVDNSDVEQLQYEPPVSFDQYPSANFVQVSEGQLANAVNKWKPAKPVDSIDVIRMMPGLVAEQWHHIRSLHRGDQSKSELFGPDEFNTFIRKYFRMARKMFGISYLFFFVIALYLMGVVGVFASLGVAAFG